jgi:Protein of unknown function (DUF4054)
MITPTIFRQNFNAFADPGVFDDNSINLFLGVAGNLMNDNRWGGNADEVLDGNGNITTMGTQDYGICLFTAHHLVLMARDNATVRADGLPGTVEGVRNAKSVDKVSVSYDTEGVMIKGGDFWNMTQYGIRFLHLARMMGTGGALQLISVGPLYGDGGTGWPGFVAQQ